MLLQALFGASISLTRLCNTSRVIQATEVKPALTEAGFADNFFLLEKTQMEPSHTFSLIDGAATVTARNATLRTSLGEFSGPREESGGRMRE